MSWPLVKLKDCCQVVGGATPKRNIPEYWDSADVPWVTPKDVSKLSEPVLDDAPEYISDEGFRSCATSMLPKGSVLVTSRAPIGNIAITGKDMCTNQGFKSLIPGEKIDGLYLYYCMLAHSEKLQALGNGATFKEVSKKIVEGFEIPLPPLSEQKRIATILDKADAIRRKRQQAIQLADEFLRTVFLDMFGDPVTNSKGFEIKELSDFFIDNKNGTKCGPFGSALKKQEYTESGIPVWSMDNISLSGDFHDVPALWVSEEKFEELNSYSVLPGDVIISRAGTVGKMGVVRSHYEKSLISTNLIRVRFNERRLIPEYFVSLMTYCKGRVGRLKTGPDGAFTHMNTGILSSLTFPYPPIDLQKRFMEYRRKVISILDSSLEYEHEGSFALQAISRKAFSGTL